MKFFLLITIFLQINRFGIAQHPAKFDFFLGYGFYEGYNIGSEYNFKSGLQSMSLSIGFDRLQKNNQRSYCAALGYDIAIARNHKINPDQFKWRFSNRVVLWQLEDDFYLWRAVSVIPSVCRRFTFYKKIDMSFDFGPSFNIVLYNRRKTYKEVGWPYHVMPDFRLIWII